MSCFRIQREFHLFIAAMIWTENVLYSIIKAKMILHRWIVAVNILWWRFSWGKTANVFGPRSTDLLMFLAASAKIKRHPFLMIKNSLSPEYIAWMHNLTAPLIILRSGYQIQIGTASLPYCRSLSDDNWWYNSQKVKFCNTNS